MLEDAEGEQHDLLTDASLVVRPSHDGLRGLFCSTRLTLACDLVAAVLPSHSARPRLVEFIFRNSHAANKEAAADAESPACDEQLGMSVEGGRGVSLKWMMYCVDCSDVFKWL